MPYLLLEKKGEDLDLFKKHLGRWLKEIFQLIIVRNVMKTQFIIYVKGVETRQKNYGPF